MLPLLFLALFLQSDPPLADRLIAAADPAARAALLDADPSAATPDLFRLLRARADEAFARYDYAHAMPADFAALSVAERLNDREQMARTYRAIGLCIYRQGNMKEALTYFQKGLVLARAAGAGAATAQLLRIIGLAHHWMGEFDQAIADGEESLEIYRAIDDQQGVAGQILNLGTSYQQLGQLSRAAEMFRQSLDVSIATHFQDNVVHCLANLALVYSQQGDQKVALSYMERAIHEAAGPAEDARSAASRQNILGIILLHLNRYEESRRALDRGLELARKAGDQKLESTLLSAHSIILGHLGDGRGALQDLLLDNEICERMHLAETQTYILYQIADRYLMMNEPRKALPYAEQAVALARRVSSLAASWGPLQDLGRAYLALGRRQEAEAVLRDSIDNVDQWNAQVDGGDSLGLQFFDLTGYPYYVLMEMKIQDGDAETALQLSERAKARHLADVLTYGRAKARHGEAPPIQLAQIQDLLPDNRTLLVEYAVLEHEVAVFTMVRGESRPSLSLARIPIGSADLGRRVHAFHDELASRSPTYRDAARSLYTLLLAPVRARLAGKTHVVIVPDGPLWDLPFHALVDENGRHAIERFAVSYAPSLTVLRAGLRAEPVNHKLLAIGSPRGDLPNAAAEVRELGRLYGAADATVLTGAAANQARWKEDAPRNGILHLATHGVLNNENPLYSYLELHGGALEARDVLALDLHAALVVLSACETARGELHSGEGVVGMAWAMMIAGAPSVVVSQWKVDSTGTTQLMVAFHRQLQAGALKSKSTALRTAALALMRRPEYRHPFYWAGFELLGDGY